MGFVPGSVYTRRQIAEELGGGSVQDYLPAKDGKIICACLSQDFDPAAPVILVGRGPGVQRQAEIFCGQGTAVPVFFKKEANQWEYTGDFTCDHWSEDKETIGTYEDRSGRTQLTRVIFLKAG